MDELITRLIKIVIEKQQSNPQADVIELANDLKAAVQRDQKLASLASNRRIVQINQGNARAFQTLVNGGIANIGTHVHSDPEALKAVLEHFFQKLQAEPIKSPPLTRQEYHNRKALLTNVNNYWVKSVLEKSIYNQVLIQLELEERLDAVVNPLSMLLETGDSSPQPLPKGTKVINIFDQIGAGRTLLILGEPGAGKTTTLLELTRDLVNRTEPGLDYRIPVVLNLSSWAGKKQSIADWLVEELNSKYQIPKPIGQDWVKKQELLLLLDGLDEVKAEYRDNCVVALNDFQQNYALEMVVCSRIKDYSALSNRLNFQSAVYLRSLTPEQARHYLDSLNADLTGLRALIQGDTALQELAKSPLMLSIMVLAYEGVAVEDLPNNEMVEERRKQLFDAYIKRMFRPPTRLKVEQKYSEVQSIRWLTWLAQRMVQESQTVFLIEEMQPTWLPTKYTTYKKILYRIAVFWIGWLILGLIIGLILGLIKGLTFGLIKGLTFGLINRVISEWISGLSLGLILGLISAWGNLEIKTVETIKWSWIKAYNTLISGLIYNFIIGLIIGLIVVLIYGPIYGSISGLIGGLIIGLIGGLTFGLINGLLGGMKGSAIATKTTPNQGIYRTAMNAGIVGLIVGLIFGLIFGLFSGQSFALIIRLTYVLVYGLIFGSIAMIWGGGKACIQHLTLRLILYQNGYIPWNYARFLDYATEHIFLQKVGGGYIFIHRLLLEHFAQMEL
jgi:DNA polymerase III delta prime subunit